MLYFQLFMYGGQVVLTVGMAVPLLYWFLFWYLLCFCIRDGRTFTIQVTYCRYPKRKVPCFLETDSLPFKSGLSPHDCGFSIQYVRFD